jgi:Fe2+ or Zn2+ uptake regulation protein
MPVDDDRVVAVLDILRARGGRVTESRRLLLRCLFERQGHRTADELVEEVNARDPAVHRSTIYRNLDELEQLGVVEHVHLGHGPATYHLRAERHGHLVCEHCGRSVAVPDELFADLEQVALRRYGFHLRPRHFAVQVICASCAASEATDPTTAYPSTTER